MNLTDELIRKKELLQQQMDINDDRLRILQRIIDEKRDAHKMKLISNDETSLVDISSKNSNLQKDDLPKIRSRLTLIQPRELTKPCPFAKDSPVMRRRETDLRRALGLNS